MAGEVGKGDWTGKVRSKWHWGRIKISHCTQHCLAPLLPMMSKSILGAVFFCSRSMFSAKRSNRKSAMALCCTRKIWTPLKRKTQRMIFLGILPLVPFLCTCKTLFRGQIIVFLWHKTRPTWHFEWQDRGEILDYFSFIVIFKCIWLYQSLLNAYPI